VPFWRVARDLPHPLCSAISAGQRSFDRRLVRFGRVAVGVPFACIDAFWGGGGSADQGMVGVSIRHGGDGSIRKCCRY